MNHFFFLFLKEAHIQVKWKKKKNWALVIDLKAQIFLDI